MYLLHKRNSCRKTLEKLPFAKHCQKISQEASPAQETGQGLQDAEEAPGEHWRAEQYAARCNSDIFGLFSHFLTNFHPI